MIVTYYKQLHPDKAASRPAHRPKGSKNKKKKDPAAAAIAAKNKEQQRLARQCLMTDKIRHVHHRVGEIVSEIVDEIGVGEEAAVDEDEKNMCFERFEEIKCLCGEVCSSPPPPLLFLMNLKFTVSYAVSSARIKKLLTSS